MRTPKSEQLKDAAIVVAPFLCVVGVAVRPGLVSALLMLAAVCVVLACNVRALRATYRRDQLGYDSSPTDSDPISGRCYLCANSPERCEFC